jgi:hypothetical protein
MKFKITPGPWHGQTAKDFMTGLRDPDGIVCGIYTDGRDVKRTIIRWLGLARPHSEESQANALAISRVPEMLALLYEVSDNPRRKRGWTREARALLEGLVEDDH